MLALLFRCLSALCLGGGGGSRSSLHNISSWCQYSDCACVFPILHARAHKHHTHAHTNITLTLSQACTINVHNSQTSQGTYTNTKQSHIQTPNSLTYRHQTVSYLHVYWNYLMNTKYFEIKTQETVYLCHQLCFFSFFWLDLTSLFSIVSCVLRLFSCLFFFFLIIKRYINRNNIDRLQVIKLQNQNK